MLARLDKLAIAVRKTLAPGCRAMKIKRLPPTLADFEALPISAIGPAEESVKRLPMEEELKAVEDLIDQLGGIANASNAGYHDLMNNCKAYL